MSSSEQSKKIRGFIPYIIVGLLFLFVGQVIVGVFTGESSKPGVEWQPYSEAAIAEALKQNKPIMIYFAADWCEPCHVLRQETFTDADVRAEAERFLRFKVDLTNPKGEIAKAEEKYYVGGLPMVVFIGSDGNERIRLRLLGFEEAARFRQRMKAVQ